MGNAVSTLSYRAETPLSKLWFGCRRPTTLTLTETKGSNVLLSPQLLQDSEAWDGVIVQVGCPLQVRAVGTASNVTNWIKPQLLTLEEITLWERYVGFEIQWCLTSG